MTLGELKPLLAALALPPISPLLAILAGSLLAWRAPSRKSAAMRRWGWALVLLGTVSLWLLSCNAVAVWLARTALPPVNAITPGAAKQLQSAGVQAIVVLGGGALPDAVEYGRAQPTASTAMRLRYGFFLAKASGLPLAFAGGVGWAAAGTKVPSEASTAVEMARENGLAFRWLDADSRDTAENAARMQALLARDGIQRIALVTQAWHLPRSQRHFEAVGLTVLAAPTGFIGPLERPLLEWLPSAHGLTATRQVLREWLALRQAGY